MNKQHTVRFIDKTIIQNVSESVLPLKYRVYAHTDIFRCFINIRTFLEVSIATQKYSQ